MRALALWSENDQTHAVQVTGEPDSGQRGAERRGLGAASPPWTLWRTEQMLGTPSLREVVSSLGTGTKGPSSERGPCSFTKCGNSKGEFLHMVLGVPWQSQTLPFS